MTKVNIARTELHNIGIPQNISVVGGLKGLELGGGCLIYRRGAGNKNVSSLLHVVMRYSEK